MGGVPDAIFVIDTIKEDLAIKEAQKLGIPVIAIVDTNSDPEGLTYPIPGNDDALRAIETYCELISGAILDGLQAEATAKGVDLGAAEGKGRGKKSAEVVKLETTEAELAQEEPKVAQGGN
jgi:small subunit ribosomal protein S2